MHPLTAGLEVHQQLNTRKLFCDCPSTIRDDQPNFTIERVLRAASGETGTTDIAARAESRKGKRFRYQGYDETTCLVELDEEPVSEPQPAALLIALQVAKLLKIQPFDELHVMRKTVVDGSNTAGFQRTMLVGAGGSITVDGNDVRIEQLCLEEDSSKVIERTPAYDVYNLSRLGIPLLEITTGPDLHSPQQVKAVAAHIGMLLRSTESVKRGLGTIRQDVNVSVPGGNRVELKGAQDLDTMDTLVEYEMQRQKVLINLSKAIPQQQYVALDVSAALKHTKAKFIAGGLGRGHKAIGIRLTNWREALETTLMPGVKLGKELAGYAKAAGFGGLIHSAEDFSKYPLATTEVETIRDVLACSSDDGWLFMVGEQGKLLGFIEHTLIPRLEQLSIGVPQEVRKAESDSTSSYLRPMPGASRMYPETDVRPITPPDMDSVPVPELISERSLRLQREYGISRDLAEQIAVAGLGSTFESWAAAYLNVPPTTIATLLVSKEKEIRTRHNLDIDIVALAPLVLEQLDQQTIALSSIEDILVTLAKHEPIDFSSYKPVDDAQVRAVLEQLVNDNPDASLGLLMGKAMRHFENKVDGKLVQQQLRELMR